MTESIPQHLRRRVEDRARGRCEYCGLAQAGQEATFHVDHIVPRRTGGPTEQSNLALACVGCSLRKAARHRAADPVSGTDVTLFHPRRDRWDDHFHVEGFSIVGDTATGRATVDALGMNRAMLVSIREEQFRLGRHPNPRH